MDNVSISIGILAWNEEKNIAKTINSILEQSVFISRNHAFSKIEIICVANACTDSTAVVAENALSKLDGSKVSYKVVSIEKSGKANAWNRFIHDYSDQKSDVVLLLDADVQLLGVDTLYSMVLTLFQDDGLLAVTDFPVKHLEFKEQKSITDKLSLSLSKITQGSSAQLTGQLYGIRGNFARSIWMPDNYVAFQDDGFLKQVVVTKGFTEPANVDLIKKAPDASHVFEAYSDLRDIVNNQIRQATNVVILGFIIDELKTLKKQNEHIDLGEIIFSLNQSNHNWVADIINKKVDECGFFVIPSFYFFARLKKIRIINGFYQKLIGLPTIFIGFFVDLVAYLIANHKIKHQSYQSVWKDTQNKKL